MIPLFFFLFGIAIGSFLNVCISRIPEGLSIISPGSRCPRCLAPIQPYDNIPILSWLILRGKCRTCSLPISPMYPITECLTGLLFVLTYNVYGITLETFKWLIFTCLIVVLVVTDLRERILPDAVNWPGFGVGLVFSARIPPSDSTAISLYFHLGFHLLRPWMVYVLGAVDALLGALLGSFLLWGAATLYKLIRKREGMGLGDVKMMAMVGAFLGPRGAFLTILIGTLLGSVIGLTWVAGLYSLGWKRKVAERAARRNLGSLRDLRWVLAAQYQLPLGSFLGVGALAVVYAVPWFFSRFLL